MTTTRQDTADGLRADAILRRIADVEEPVVVEVGVAGGRLSERILAGHPGATLHMVDSYLPAPKQPQRYRESGDVHATFDVAHQQRTRRIAAARVRAFRERARIWVLDSLHAARRFDDESLDLVFLDADHTYEGVTEDLRAWWPKVRRGGWLGGHDYGGWALVHGRRRYFGVERAVDEAADALGWTVELDEDWTWFVRREPGGRP